MIITVVMFILCGLTTTACAAMLGLNDFDLARQYLGVAAGGDGSDRYRRVEVAMANKALHDAKIAGAAFVRVSATGFAPSVPGERGDLSLWLSDPGMYWLRLDEMMTALDMHKLRGVFTLVWNPLQFPSLAAETVRDLVTNPKSQSYRLAARYVDQFVKRYRGRRTLLFYELTNELNLMADLDLQGRCKNDQNKPLCDSQGNYTTDEMIAFCKRLAMVIRNADPKAKISTGFALPRKAAEHIRAHPEWVTGETDFTPDSIHQFERNLRDIHSMADIISVHIYPDADNVRFGASNLRSTVTLDASVQAARKIGKPLFIGEFGDTDRVDADDSSFLVRMMDKIGELRPDYSAPWVWEFYQTSLYRTHDSQATLSSMEPGITDRQIIFFRRLAKLLGQSVPEPDALKNMPPHVVLTWPLDCTLLLNEQLVYAVASDDSAPLRSVDFFLDGNLVAQTRAPPYEAEISSGGLTRGSHVLKARAVNATGLTAEFATPVAVGGVKAVGVCSHGLPSSR